jgi:hypothetical protein
MKRLLKQNEPTDSPLYISTYTSFKGEVFENIIYEHLLTYAANEPLITQFVLKGPYWHKKHRFYKSGLMIDSSSQIVYKSAYKDISEFDALFFTKESIYFVEMSTSKKTESLIKRLYKKHALLRTLFPHLEVRALIVLTKGSKGLSKFPSYCTVWVTNDIEDEAFLKEVVFHKEKPKQLYTKRDKKFIPTYRVKYKKFQYFQTLEDILQSCRGANSVIDLEYFKKEPLLTYFDIFTKLYIGFTNEEEFKTIYPAYDLKAKENKIIVTLEKINNKVYDLVYYVKQTNGKLKRIYITASNEIKLKDKELDGFTNTEIRFIFKILKSHFFLSANDIISLKGKGFNF